MALYGRIAVYWLLVTSGTQHPGAIYLPDRHHAAAADATARVVSRHTFPNQIQ